MKLNEYVETAGIPAFAKLIGVTPAFVYQLKKGSRPVPIERCIPIERATSGAVTRKDLRPDDWHEIWPEAASPDWQPTTEPAAAGV